MQKAKDFLNKKLGRVKEEKSPVDIEDSYDEKTLVLPEHFNDPQYKPLTKELKEVKIKMQKLSQLLTMDTYMFIVGENENSNEFNIVFPEEDNNRVPKTLTDPEKKEIVLDKLQEYSDTFFNGLKDHDYNLWLREKNLEYFDDNGKIPPILIFKKSKDSVSSGPLGRNYHDSNDINMDPQIKKTKEIKGMSILKNEFSNRGKELGFYGAIPALAAAFSPLLGGPVGTIAATVASSTLASKLDKDKKKDMFDLLKDINEVFEKVDPFMKDFKLHHVEESDGGRDEPLKEIYNTKDTHEGSKEIFNFAPFTRELKTYVQYKEIKEKLSEMKKKYKEAKKEASDTPDDTYQKLKKEYNDEKKNAPVEVISKSDIKIKYLNFNVKNFCSQIEVNNDNTLKIKNFYDKNINFDDFKNHIEIIHNCIYSYFTSKDDGFKLGYEDFTNVIVQILYLMMEGTDKEKIQKTYFFSVLCIKKINTIKTIVFTFGVEYIKEFKTLKKKLEKKKTIIKLLFSKNKIQFPNFDKIYDELILVAGITISEFNEFYREHNLFKFSGNQIFSIQFFINFIDCLLFTPEFSTTDNMKKVCRELMYDTCFLNILYNISKNDGKTETDSQNENSESEAYDDITSLTIQYIILQFLALQFPLFEDWQTENYTLLLGNKNDIEKYEEERKAAISKLLEQKIPELNDLDYKISLGYDVNDDVNDEIKKKLEPEIGNTVNFKIPKESSDSSFSDHLIDEKKKILSEAKNADVAIERINNSVLSSDKEFEIYEGVIANIDKNKNIITIVFTIEGKKYFELYTPKEFLEERILEIVDLKDEEEERKKKIAEYKKYFMGTSEEMTKLFPPPPPQVVPIDSGSAATSATKIVPSAADATAATAATAAPAAAPAAATAAPAAATAADKPSIKRPGDNTILPSLGNGAKNAALKRMQERLKILNSLKMGRILAEKEKRTGEREMRKAVIAVGETGSPESLEKVQEMLEAKKTDGGPGGPSRPSRPVVDLGSSLSPTKVVPAGDTKDNTSILELTKPVYTEADIIKQWLSDDENPEEKKLVDLYQNWLNSFGMIRQAQTEFRKKKTAPMYTEERENWKKENPTFANLKINMPKREREAYENYVKQFPNFEQPKSGVITGGYKNFPSILTLRRAANKKSKSVNIKYIKRRRKKTDPNLTKRRRVKIHRSKSQKVKKN